MVVSKPTNQILQYGMLFWEDLKYLKEFRNVNKPDLSFLFAY